MIKIVQITGLLLVSGVYLYGFKVPESYTMKTDSLFNNSDIKTKTFVGVFRDENSRTVYYASTTKMFGYNCDTLKKHLTALERYDEYFTFIKKHEIIDNYKNAANDDVFFSVASAAFAKALFIGSIDSIVVDKNVKIHYNKNHDSLLNERYFNREKGILKVEFHEFNMCFTIRKIDESTSYVGLVGIVSPKIWIPKWLFRMTAHFLYPSILSDFEKALEKEYSEKEE